MEAIGKDGAVSETAYHSYSWPLFRVFRRSSQFEAAYEKVFGYPFAKKLSEDATNAVAAAAQQEGEEEADDNEFPDRHIALEKVDDRVDRPAIDAVAVSEAKPQVAESSSAPQPPK